MHNFKNLKVWQESISLSTDIYQLTSKFPTSEQFGLISQMRKCCVSIASNIAEGTSRESQKDFLRFLSIALGSSFELETQLLIAGNLKYFEIIKFNNFYDRIQAIQKMIIGFQKQLIK